MNYQKKLKTQLLNIVLNTKSFFKNAKISHLNAVLTEDKKDITVFHQTNNSQVSEDSQSDILDILKQDVNQCMKCSFSTTRTNTVFGTGNINSSVFIIGEGPGRDEDLQGEPFVGRAGQLLDRMLAAIALSREDIFITNIVKCRPPNNRTPEKEEAKVCGEYLIRQLNYSNPKFLLLLGKTAMSYFFNDYKSALGKFRGLHKLDDRDIVVTYHPAAVLRSPERWKPLVWEDLKIFAQLLYQNDYYNQEQIDILLKNKVIIEG